MADSDEEHERSRSRDKFRKERSDYGDKSRSRGDYRDRRTWREDHEASRRRSRDDYEDERERRRHSSPGRGRDWSPPPHKRMRREAWEGFHGFPPDMMGPYGMRGPWMPPDMPGGMHHMPPRPGGLPGDSMGSPSLGPKKQAMLSFKQFLTQQDDSIDESKAIQLYQEYKTEFKRKQIMEFFDEHKEEDWLISKYHPKHMASRKESQKANLQSRLKAFLFLLESGRLDSIPLWSECTENIIRTMDTAVIIMEGGNEHDLLSLDQTPSGQDKEEGTGKAETKVEEVEENKEKAEENSNKDKPLFMMVEPTEEQRQLAQQARAYGQQMQALTGIEAEQANKKKKKKKQQASDDKYSYSGNKSDGTSGESEAEDDQPEVTEEPPPPGLESPPSKMDSESGEAGGRSSQALPETGQTESHATSTGTGNGSGPPRSFHITRSVYMRHIPPKVASEDIVEICRTIPGYLRIAFADPDPNRGYERRGWVTYSHTIDIREVTARLTTNKVKDVQLNCMVNRELTRRVKVGQEVSWASRAVHMDLHLLLRLVTALDKKMELWEYGEEGNGKTNPVLAIPEPLLSEEGLMVTGGGEEEEGVVSDPGTEIMSENDSKVKALDLLIWYLRVVHSVDYYNAMVFPTEDCMPHRCGIFTVRPHKPTALTQDDVSSYIESMESRIKPMLETKKELSEDEMEKYGKKDPESEVERFIEVNTQKLAENKYLCPLSGKKFKGPDFVRKHILNKHMDKVEAVRQETELFNNYLRDPDRPLAAEATCSIPILPPSASSTPGGDDGPTTPGGGGPGAWGQGPQMMFGRGGFTPGMGGFPPGMMGRGGFRPRGGHRGRGRKIVNYHDLDAPEEMY